MAIKKSKIKITVGSYHFQNYCYHISLAKYHIRKIQLFLIVLNKALYLSKI